MPEAKSLDGNSEGFKDYLENGQRQDRYGKTPSMRPEEEMVLEPTPTEEARYEASVSLITCSLGQVRIEWAVMLATTIYPLGWRLVTIPVRNLPVSDARNVGLTKSNQQECKYAFFWDDDIIPRDRGAFTRLLSTMEENPQITALSAIYPRRAKGLPEPIVITHPGGSASWDWTDGKLHKVYMAGTGFMALRMSDINEMEIETKTMERSRAYPGGDVRQVFLEGNTETGYKTDDYVLADRLVDAGKEWWVLGETVCDQVDLDGYPYRVEAARPPKIEEAVHA